MKNRSVGILVFLCLLISLVWFSCAQQGDTPPQTPTSGTTSVVADESYKLLFDTEVHTFQSLYKYATVHIKYLPENQALQYLLADSCKVIAINRDLSDAEREEFKKQKFYPKSVKILEDAVALIVHKDNTDTLITVDQLKNLLTGTDTLWNQKAPVKIVFDNPGSSNTRYLKELIGGADFFKNCYSLKSNTEVIDYVSKNTNAIGVISVNWISDRDDTLSQQFLKEIKVMSVAESADTRYVKPYQGYIKTKDYPLCRDVYMINREGSMGPGTGFVAFVAGDIGQRIILKSGLIPAVAPTRLVNIKH